MLGETHFVQLAAIICMAAINLAGFVLVHREKRGKNRGQQVSWDAKRNVFWAYMLIALVCNISLDAQFSINGTLVPVKAYLFAFPVGLLDLCFATVDKVSPKIIVGALIWCSTVLIRNALITTFAGADALGQTVTDVSLLSLGTELIRYTVMLPLVGESICLRVILRCAAQPPNTHVILL